MVSGTRLQRSGPEAEGIPSSAILNFIRAVDPDDQSLAALHGFMLLRHGNVVAEGWWAPYGPETPHSLFSLSKSFTSTAIGLAVAEGLLTVDDPVLKFFPDEAPATPSDNLKAMRVRHLLSMNTGHDEDTTKYVFRDRHPVTLFGPSRPRLKATGREILGEDDTWPKRFLSLPVPHEPGTWFVYNTGATYMLSAIISKLTGEHLVDYLRPRLFEPLGIDHPFWETDPRGVSIGGTGLHLKTEDIACFGQLYLQQGIWQGKRIVPQAWIAEATRAHSDNSNTQTNPDWMVGYGYQFWRCRHDAYRGDGAFGQYCIVMPEQDAVLAINSGLLNLQGVLDKVWQHLLPAMQSAPLPANPVAANELRDKLASLSLPLAKGQPTSAKAAQWSGKTFKLESNHLNLERVAIEFSSDGAIIIVGDGHGEHPIPVGYGTWRQATTDLRGLGDESVAASGAWTTDATYEVRICFYEGEFCPVVRFHHANDRLQVEIEPNVAWDALTITTIRS